MKVHATVPSNGASFENYSESNITETMLHTRDTMMAIAMGLLEAMDHLALHYQWSTRVVRRVKRKLGHFIHQYIEDTEDAHHRPKGCSQTLAEKIIAYQKGSRLLVDDALGFVEWLRGTMAWLQSLAFRCCQGAWILLTYVPGVPKAQETCTNLYRILEKMIHSEQAAATIRRNSSRSSTPSNHSLSTGSRYPQYFNSPDDAHLTAVLLDYRENENAVPSSMMSRRIQRMMHFQVSLRPFEATVMLPFAKPAGEYDEDEDSGMYASACSFPPDIQLAITPKSIPGSPLARLRVERAFSNFADDVLYQARDQLRKEREETLTGTAKPPVATFNPQDTHEDILLSCGLHCASKVGSGLYRTARCTMPIPFNRYVYFQMSISSLEENPHQRAPASSNHIDPQNGLCIGLSTQDMPLNTLVGTWKHSIGFYSSGHIITGSHWRHSVSVNSSYESEDTIGVLVYIDDSQTFQFGEGLTIAMRIQFAINGHLLRDDHNKRIIHEIQVPPESQVYPTTTLYSTHTQVMSRFAAADIVLPHVGDDILQLASNSVETRKDIWCLDDTKLKWRIMHT